MRPFVAVIRILPVRRFSVEDSLEQLREQLMILVVAVHHI